MYITDELQFAIDQLQNGEFKSMREYDESLIALQRACSTAHRNLTVSAEGGPYAFEVSRMCRDFVVDEYFGGKFPSKARSEERRLVERVRTTLVSILREPFGLGHQTQIYSDEISEMRIRLMNRPLMRELLESKVGAKTRIALEELRSTK